MATTLILKSQSALLSPLAGTPTLPDTQTGLIYDLKASDLALSDGATVTSWVASGTAPLVNRTYNFAYTGWSFPTYSVAGGPGGQPAVMFNGSQEIFNNAGTVAVNQPVTYAIVVKSTAFASTQARILGSGSQIIAPGNNGYYASISAASRLESGSNTTGWTVMIVVFNDTSSKIKIGSGATVTGPTGAAASARNGLGGQGSTLSGVGLQGGIAQVKAYNRALNDSDIDALSLTLMRAYNLT